MNRVGQVWEFGGSDYIGLIVRSRDRAHDWLHDVVWLVQDNKPGLGDVYLTTETAFGVESHGTRRID